jgi:hypothetical protein
MNEYFRLKIEYLWNAVYLKKTEHSDSLIFNSQFPDKAGFTLRYNPASGISAAPDRLSSSGLGIACKKGEMALNTYGGVVQFG